MSALPLHHEYTAPLTHEQCQSEFLICILGTDGYRKYSANVTDLPKSDRAFFSLLNQRYWEEQRRLCRWLSWLSLTRVTDIELVEFSSFPRSSSACIENRYPEMPLQCQLRTEDKYKYKITPRRYIWDGDLAYLFPNPKEADRRDNLFPYFPRKQVNDRV